MIDAITNRPKPIFPKRTLLYVYIYTYIYICGMFQPPRPQPSGRLPKNGWAMLGLWQLCCRRWGHENSTCHELQRNFSKAWSYADATGLLPHRMGVPPNHPLKNYGWYWILFFGIHHLLNLWKPLWLYLGSWGESVILRVCKRDYKPPEVWILLDIGPITMVIRYIYIYYVLLKTSESIDK